MKQQQIFLSIFILLLIGGSICFKNLNFSTPSLEKTSQNPLKKEKPSRKSSKSLFIHRDRNLKKENNDTNTNDAFVTNFPGSNDFRSTSSNGLIAEISDANYFFEKINFKLKKYEVDRSKRSTIKSYTYEPVPGLDYILKPSTFKENLARLKITYNIPSAYFYMYNSKESFLFLRIKFDNIVVGYKNFYYSSKSEMYYSAHFQNDIIAYVYNVSKTQHIISLEVASDSYFITFIYDAFQFPILTMEGEYVKSNQTNTSLNNNLGLITPTLKDSQTIIRKPGLLIAKYFLQLYVYTQNGLYYNWSLYKPFANMRDYDKEVNIMYVPISEDDDLSFYIYENNDDKNGFMGTLTFYDNRGFLYMVNSNTESFNYMISETKTISTLKDTYNNYGSDKRPIDGRASYIIKENKKQSVYTYFRTKVPSKNSTAVNSNFTTYINTGNGKSANLYSGHEEKHSLIYLTSCDGCLKRIKVGSESKNISGNKEMSVEIISTWTIKSGDEVEIRIESSSNQKHFLIAVFYYINSIGETVEFTTDTVNWKCDIVPSVYPKYVAETISNQKSNFPDGMDNWLSVSVESAKLIYKPTESSYTCKSKLP